MKKCLKKSMQMNMTTSRSRDVQMISLSMTRDSVIRITEVRSGNKEMKSMLKAKRSLAN